MLFSFCIHFESFYLVILSPWRSKRCTEKQCYNHLFFFFSSIYPLKHSFIFETYFLYTQDIFSVSFDILINFFLFFFITFSSPPFSSPPLFYFFIFVSFVTLFLFLSYYSFFFSILAIFPNSFFIYFPSFSFLLSLFYSLIILLSFISFLSFFYILF